MIKSCGISLARFLFGGHNSFKLRLKLGGLMNFARTSVPFDRILSIFLPGSLVMLGVWYFHRPFLLKYFPHIASDVGHGGAGGATKAIIFLVAATCMGVLINQLNDLAIVGLVRDKADTKKTIRRKRKILRALFFIFSPSSESDPRVRAVERYLCSTRKDIFLEMVKKWTGVDESALGKPNEAILVHQHITMRVNTLSDNSRTVTQEAFNQVVFSCSLFVSIFLLFPVALLSFITARFVSETVQVHPDIVLLILTILVYCVGFLAAYNVKRRFAHFCQHVISIGLHYYLIDKKELPQ